MNTRRWTSCGLALVLAFTVGTSAAKDGVAVTHAEALGRIQLGGGPDQAAKPATAAPLELSFDAFGRRFQLDLEPNANLLSAIPAGLGAAKPIPYRGRVRGAKGSWARIVVTRGMPAGLVFDGSELYALEVPGDGIIERAAPFAYRLADVVIEPGALRCASDAGAQDGAAVFRAVVAGLGTAVAQAPGAIDEIEIGAVGDFEFTDAHSADAVAAILTRLNNVDGIFSEQLGVQITVPVVDVFPDAGDPFTDTTVPGDLLDELGSYRFTTASQRSRGLTHLFTGRDLDGSTVGIAYTGVLCRSSVGVGLSEGNRGAVFDSLVAAHEIGHNFGAPHDAESGSACESEPPDYLMATTLNGSDQFSACSIAEMQDDVAAASCITALPGTDISLAFNGASATALLGSIARVTIDVVNNGTDVAGNVFVDVTLPGIVSYLDASGGSAICTAGTGAVSCALGDVAGGSAVTLAVSADAVATGSGTYTASVTADADDRPVNNQDSLQLRIDPAVDLSIRSPSAPAVDLQQATTISATLDNLASLDASGVTLVVTLDSGLRAESANWSIGACTIAAQRVDCTADRFDALSNSAISIGVTGLIAGNRSYTIELASSEADADEADNNVAGSVRVNGNGGGDEEGGGSLGWPLLSVLGSLVLLRSTFRGARQVRDVG